MKGYPLKHHVKPNRFSHLTKLEICSEYLKQGLQTLCSTVRHSSAL